MTILGTAFEPGAPAATENREAMLSGLAGWPFPVVGPGARLMEAAAGQASIAEIAAPSLEALARLASRAAPAADVRPLYLRPPDARPMTP